MRRLATTLAIALAIAGTPRGLRLRRVRTGLRTPVRNDGERAATPPPGGQPDRGAAPRGSGRSRSRGHRRRERPRPVAGGGPPRAEGVQPLRGATNSANAQPLLQASAPGFYPDPGTSQTEGALPRLTAELDALAKSLHVIIYGISGYRSPAHSVAVGGFANDPHTQGLAEDIGVNSLLRSGAAQISEAQLARFGLYRPFDPSDDPNNPEVNHLQLIPAGGPLSLTQSTAAFDPDPTCR